MKIAPDANEIYRYLGVPSPDPDTARMAAECVSLLDGCADARFASRVFGVEIKGNSVLTADREFVSSGLARHLSGCPAAILFAMTLGADVDRLAVRLSRTRIALAAVFQAAAAAYAEAACDTFCADMADAAKEGGLFPGTSYLTTRFSPGYGDLPLKTQKDVLAVLNAPVRIGLTLTESFMLAPTKSVTAFIGLSPVPAKSCYGECSLCSKTDCAFRKKEN